MPMVLTNSSLWRRTARGKLHPPTPSHAARPNKQTNRPANRITTRVSIKKIKHQHPRYRVSDRTALRSDWCKHWVDRPIFRWVPPLNRQTVASVGAFAPLVCLSVFFFLRTFMMTQTVFGGQPPPRGATTRRPFGGVRYFVFFYFVAKNGNFSRACIHSGIPLG